MRSRYIAHVLLFALPLMAQLPAPNKAGIAAGHDVLGAKDVEAANKFWEALGRERVQFAGRLNLVNFPGVLLLEVGGGQGKASPSTELAGSDGSSLDFIGFSVKDLKGSLARWAEGGIKPVAGGSARQ